MPKGFIYVMSTVTRYYEQQDFCNIPTEWEDRLYFGACKVPMRPKMRRGDFIFGISGSNTSPRRIVFVAKIEDCITFAEAYNRFPDLRGPHGPIHVRPLKKKKREPFPRSSYEHIPHSIHGDRWEGDLASSALDAFFVCSKADGCAGCWLGASGPEIGGEILDFLKKCSVHGMNISDAQNKHASINRPIVYRGPRGGDLMTGLHLETNAPEFLVELCNQWLSPQQRFLDHLPIRKSFAKQTRGCGPKRSRRGLPIRSLFFAPALASCL